MSTYCISDIHGNLSALQALLVEVNFQYDGSDRLFLLGDYIDWGPKAIETLQFVMRLSKEPYVTCLMGNHDLMFLDQIIRSDCGNVDGRYDDNWLYGNRGIVTWEQYLNLAPEEREEIRDWLLARPFSAEVCVDGRWYLLGHAGPYLPEEDITEDERRFKQMDAVWHRMKGAHENPLEDLYLHFPETTWEHRDYESFICGHSITYHYQPVSEEVPYSIFKGRFFTDLDCGAKCMGLVPGRDNIPGEVIAQSRLSALRLEDQKEFYCDRKKAGYEPVTEEEE
jgi:diadenosine tetraphosphatase ApaH/serine/threonine PP2A family protein phosphatase